MAVMEENLPTSVKISGWSDRMYREMAIKTQAE